MYSGKTSERGYLANLSRKRSLKRRVRNYRYISRHRMCSTPFVEEEHHRRVLKPHTIDNLLEEFEGFLHAIDASLLIQRQIVFTQRSEEDDCRHLTHRGQPLSNGLSAIQISSHTLLVSLIPSDLFISIFSPSIFHFSFFLLQLPFFQESFSISSLSL